MATPFSQISTGTLVAGNGVSAATAVATSAAGLAGLILVTPQNTVGYQPFQNGDGIPYQAPSIVFHYEGENTSLIESDITDHYIEDNTAIQDQIALKPVVITTQGFVGELNDIPPNKVLQALQTAAQKLTVISGYTPGLSITALNSYNEALFAYQTAANVINNGVSAWNSLTGNSGTTVIDGLSSTPQPNQNKQQQYYQQFYGYWIQRALFTIQTPWAIFQDMAILSIKATQSPETNVITDFAVKFKQMRFASVLSEAVDVNNPSNVQGQLSNQISASNPTNLGTNALNPTTVSLGTQLNALQ